MSSDPETPRPELEQERRYQAQRLDVLASDLKDTRFSEACRAGAAAIREVDALQQQLQAARASVLSVADREQALKAVEILRKMTDPFYDVTVLDDGGNCNFCFEIVGTDGHHPTCLYAEARSLLHLPQEPTR